MFQGSDYASALEAVLPPDLPRRAAVVRGCAAHAVLLAAANERHNLTRIVEPRELAIKHVLDSVLPWKLLEPAESVLDLGSGAGYPGIPLALVLPPRPFFLVESIGKKARVIEEFVRALPLTQVTVHAARAETFLKQQKVDWVVARAVASVRELLRLLKPVRLQFSHLLLYKGKEAARELEEAEPEARKLGWVGAIRGSCELPSGAGTRQYLVFERS